MDRRTGATGAGCALVVAGALLAIAACDATHVPPATTAAPPPEPQKTLTLCGIRTTLKVIEPAPDVPEKYRWFSGIWEGGQMHLLEEEGAKLARPLRQGPSCSALLVEHVSKTGDVVATYFYGPWAGGTRGDQWRSFNARITGDVLTGLFYRTSDMRFVRQGDSRIQLRWGGEAGQVLIGTQRIWGLWLRRVDPQQLR